MSSASETIFPQTDSPAIFPKITHAMVHTGPNKTYHHKHVLAHVIFSIFHLPKITAVKIPEKSTDTKGNDPVAQSTE